jgi:hypothetical protein
VTEKEFLEEVAPVKFLELEDAVVIALATDVIKSTGGELRPRNRVEAVAYLNGYVRGVRDYITNRSKQPTVN